MDYSYERYVLDLDEKKRAYLNSIPVWSQRAYNCQ